MVVPTYIIVAPVILLSISQFYNRAMALQLSGIGLAELNSN